MPQKSITFHIRWSGYKATYDIFLAGWTKGLQQFQCFRICLKILMPLKTERSQNQLISMARVQRT